MIKKKKFIIIFFLTMFVGMLILPMVNLIIDRWRVLSKDFYGAYQPTKGNPKVNVNFLRLQYLLDHQDSYDSVIFGSSRVFQGVGESDLNHYLGGSWFKLTSPGGMLNEHVHNLKVLIENNIDIKRISLGIDDYLYLNSPTRNDTAINKKLYPRSFVEWLDFYTSYLWQPINKVDLKIISGDVRVMKHDKTIKLYREKGRFPENGRDPTRHAQYINSLKYGDGDARFIYKSSESALKSFYSYIEDVVSLCELNNIELILFFTPRHYQWIYPQDIYQVVKAKKGLAAIWPYYDFSWITPLTVNPENWFELSHFNGSVGSEVIRIMGEETHRESGFGSYVTKTNVDKYVEAFKSNRVDKLTELLLQDSNITVHENYSK